MKQITEDYVSFEIAKLLKEKGFDAKCDNCYVYFADDDIRFLNLNYPKSAQSLIKDRYPCVTLQLALKWLREVHKIYIYIDIEEDRGYQPNVINLNTCVNLISDMYNGYTYEQAIEAALNYVLKNLI